MAWLEAAAPDVVTMQEVRADDDQLAAALAGSTFEGWHVAHAQSSVPGRSGVAVLSRWPFAEVRTDVGRGVRRLGPLGRGGRGGRRG